MSTTAPRISAVALAALASVLAPACADDVSATTDTAATATDTTGATDTTAATETSGTTAAAPDLPPTGPLLAGVAAGYLEGPVGVSMAGYGLRAVTNRTPWNDQLNGSRGFHGLPSIKAMVLDVDGERLVFLKMPTMSAEASLTEGTADKLLADHGIDLHGRILTSSTHSHHTQARYWRLPDALGLIGADSPDEEVIDRMTSAYAEVIARAIDDLAPAEWGWAHQDDWDPDDRVYRDRRGANDPTYGKDPRLSVLALRRPGGDPLAALVNFGMHGTIFGEDNELLTEDSVGGVELLFEERYYEATGKPIFGMFVQSGGGDASPAGDHLGHRSPQVVEMVGEAAAPAIIGLLGAIQWKGELALAVRSRRVDLTYAGIGYDAYPEFKSPGGIPYTWGAWQCKGDQVDDANPATTMEGKPKSCTDVGSLLMSLSQPIPHGEVHQVYLSAALLDDLAVVTLPGEPTYSVIKYLRESLAERDLQPFAFGYSQDHLLYLTHPDDWFQGGYETEMSLWGPLAAKYLVDRQMGFVDDLLAVRDAPVFAEESAGLSLPEAFTPRARERSLAAGVALAEPAAELARLDVATFRWGGGDPTIDTPHVVLQRDPGSGVFADVPAPSGWAGAVYDNRRQHMITTYAPDPPPNGQILAERDHRWEVAWEIPLGTPSARYRLVARGQSWDGGALIPYEVASQPFRVRQAPSAALDAKAVGDALELRLTAAALPPIDTESWLSRGYRLHDPSVGPEGPFLYRGPLLADLVAITDEGKESIRLELAFDADRGAHVVDLGALDPMTLVGVRAGVVGDVIEDMIEVPVP